jgi:O-antigen/teichoic acid export membrane protein
VWLGPSGFGLMGLYGSIADLAQSVAGIGGMFYFFRSEPGAAERRRLARQESGRVCQRI